MKDLGWRKKVVGELLDPVPCEAVLLAASPQRAHPKAFDVIPEGTECRHVRRHGVVGIKAPDDLRQPSSLFGDRLVHSLSQLLLDFPELYPHAIAPSFPLELE